MIQLVLSIFIVTTCFFFIRKGTQKFLKMTCRGGKNITGANGQTREKNQDTQYETSHVLFIFAGGLLGVFIVFVVMFMAGINQWVCIGSVSYPLLSLYMAHST